MFTNTDLEQIEKRGGEMSQIKKQIENFGTGFPYLDIQKAATVRDGILRLPEVSLKHYVSVYQEHLPTIQVVKFVPASGAASRMFQVLFEFADSYKDTDEEYDIFTRNKRFDSATNFIKHIQKFAFYQDLKESYEKTENELIETAIKRRKFVAIIKTLLQSHGLNYGNLPKGLLKFHKYETKSRTPLEEHLVEGANYGRDKDGIVQIHLTVSAEHRENFVKHIEEIKPEYEKAYNIKYDVSFSEQKPSTDTIAVDMNNQPFRTPKGDLLFRPGGHGALIENLNDIDADIIFIKNIDNVVPDHLKSDTYLYKKALAGLLVSYQKQIFEYLEQLEDINVILLPPIEEFLEKELCIIPNPEYANYTTEQKVEYLKQKLNRPIRVCGMVKNEGEAGGGPFWAINTDGTTSLQIAESSQIDKNDESKITLLNESTHFNPVDLVCGVKDRFGKRFNLLHHIDPKTGFISIKSKDGKQLKAQELPGLWNGAMSDWITIFVEVPISTFNPVKTVLDLLREQHQ